MKLAAKLMFVVLAVVMLLTAVGSYFSVRRGFERFERRQQQLAKDTAATIDAQLAEAWRRRGPDGVLEATESLLSRDARHRVRWVWFERVQSGSGTTHTTVVEKILESGNNAVSKMVIDEHGNRQLQTYYPVDLDGAPLGGLEVTGSLEALDDAARETMIMALVSLGAIAAVSFATVYVAGIRWVARPLDRLIEKTERIGQGDFSSPLPIAGNDELSQLARALNGMAARLAEQQRQIHNETTERLATLEQLRHADRLKTVGRLAAGIAHELGTPLNVVSGRAGLIVSGKLAADEITNSANTIKSEADRITAIIRQLLDFARPGKSQRTAVDVGQLLLETVSLIEPLAEKRKFHVETNSSAGLTISADRSQIQQVFTNLLVNATQSMANGGTVKANLKECQMKPPGSEQAREITCVAVSFRDQGIGIPPVDLEHIFEPFFTTKDVGEGTGLGLSVAYGIVQDAGGSLSATSAPGEGSSFVVRLPVSTGSEVSATDLEPPKETS